MRFLILFLFLISSLAYGADVRVDATGNAYIKGAGKDNKPIVSENDNGNYGIGQSNPVRKLHISGPGQAFSAWTSDDTGHSGVDGTLLGLTPSDNFQIWNYENTDILFSTNNTQRVTIKADGKTELSVRTDSNCGIGNVCSGSLAPNPVVESCAGTVSGDRAQWMRVGEVITMSGVLNLAGGGCNTNQTIEIDVPMQGGAYGAGDEHNAVGQHSCGAAGAANTGFIRAHTSSERVVLVFNGGACAGGQDVYFHFTYYRGPGQP